MFYLHGLDGPPPKAPMVIEKINKIPVTTFILNYGSFDKPAKSKLISWNLWKAVLFANESRFSWAISIAVMQVAVSLKITKIFSRQSIAFERYRK